MIDCVTLNHIQVSYNMEKERFIQAKQELVSLLSNDNANNHCIESIRSVQSCNNIIDLMRVLRVFSSQIRNKNFPPYNYINKWFKDDIIETNALGMYIDQDVDVAQTSREHCLFVFGNSKVRVNISRIEMQYIHAYDNSEIILDMCSCGIANVVLHGNARLTTIDAPYSRVIVHHKND